MGEAKTIIHPEKLQCDF